MNIIDQFLGQDSANLVQFLKYAIGGCVATLVHIIIFHLVAWKMFYALQSDDWFVRVFNLPIKELDDATRSRNSMLGNGAFLVSNLVAYLINIYWVFGDIAGGHRWGQTPQS